MGYSFKPYRDDVSNDELIADLIRVAEALGENTLTQQQYREAGKYSIDKYLYRFKGWNGALRKANLQTSSNTQHTFEELYKNIERVWVAKGKQPARADMNNKAISEISSSAYLRRFGTWTKALECFVEYMNADEKSESPSDNSSPTSGINSDTRNINLRLRWKTMNRDHFRCCCCGASPAMDPAVILHVDHVIPWSKGGKTTLDNLQTLCSNCNYGKGNML